MLSRALRVSQPLSPATTKQSHIESIASVASPLRLGATPPVQHRAPPMLGEHTDEVLAGLGLAAEAVAGLRAQGVVG